MQRQILINVMIFFAYALNLPLNTQRPHHRSQRAGKLGLDFGSWQSPDISRSHLYRGTFPWTPPTAIYRAYTRAANLWNIISVFCWKNFRILSNFYVSLNLFLTRLKTFIRQLPIYSGGTHPLPVETLVDSFGTTGTGSEARKRVTTTCGREKIECFGD